MIAPQMRIIHFTPQALDQANALGLDQGGTDMTEIALAIGDSIAIDGITVSPAYFATYVGSTFERERWRIVRATRERVTFDVLYAPADARILSVHRAR